MAPVKFQEVVHPTGTEEAVCDERMDSSEGPDGHPSECPIDAS